MELLSSFGKQGVKLGLLTQKVDIEDVGYSSKYFVLTEYNPIFTAGKNAVAFNGSNLLKNKSEIQVECLDSYGNSLYLERAKSQESQYSDSSKYVISVHVYNETHNGPGKIVFVGTTAKGEIVRWIGNISIDKTLNNTSKVRFYNKPTLEVRPLLYPVIDTERAEIDFPPPPAVKAATAIAEIKSGVGKVILTGRGSGYSSAPTVTFDNSDTGGSGATAYAVLSAFGDVEQIVITNEGSEYRLAPRVVISGGSPTIAATAYATLSSRVTNITLIDGGVGYTFVPDVKFISPTGFGATALATLTDDKVTSLVLTSGGNGYIDPPDIEFDVPEEPPAPILNVPVSFSSSFVTYAGNPVKDTNKNVIDFRQTDIDYRLTMINSSFREVLEEDLVPQTFPFKAFNSQMEGKSITLHVSKVQKPFSNETINTDITSSFTIKKVIDSETVSLTEPFFYEVGKNQFVSTISEGRCFLDYRFILYNTSVDSSKRYNISPELSVDIKESYAEIVYRNLKCYSGYVTRHKLYRKSSFNPGEFQLISDELLNSNEIVYDPVTFNNFYEKIGTFYNQIHINKYWFTSSVDFTLQALTSPINSMRISASSYDAADGNKYVIVKMDTIGATDDHTYIPYDAEQYNDLSGSSYNCNFINLKKDVLYVLSTDAIIEKDTNTDAKVSFYFTSSIESIKNESTYESLHGLKLGEISTDDKVNIKYFNEKQYIYFTPADDYFGTLVVVPYKCNVILKDFSLKVYGDYGFSPDVHVIRIPFPINVANEAFDIKAELLDLNSNVVYSSLHTVQTFDENGESLFARLGDSDINAVIKIIHTTEGPDITIIGNPYLPDLENCNNNIRFVGWHMPFGTDDDGKLCYTNVSRLYVDNDNYIKLHEYQNGVEVIAKSVAVRYDFANNFGRKIVIDEAGNKETFR